MSKELELYLERKAICMVDGVSEQDAIKIAYEQVREQLPKNWIPDLIYRDLRTIELR